jgi:CubicO group peptidase (beta-lactamase class C family)
MMNHWPAAIRLCFPLAGMLALCAAAGSTIPTIPGGPSIDAKVHEIMTRTHAKGIAVAVVAHGEVRYVHAYGIRNAAGQPLTPDTVMYGASLTKTVFAYTVLQLVDQGRIKLDTPIRDDLDRPLPTYGPDPVFPDKHGPYKDLANDPRWEKITPRMCLTHSTGFNNFWFFERDQKLRIHFEPGTHFSYSGEGMILLQFVIEHGRTSQGLGLDLDNLTKANFNRLGMTRTSLVWRSDFGANVADGWNDQDQPQEHDRRKKVRVAGSMDTTISDMAKFAAALVTGDGLSVASRAELEKPSLHIGVANQFPPLQPDLPVNEQRKDLAAGLGCVVFDGPQGHGFYKGGHDGQTGNTMVCMDNGQRCVVILSNDVRAEAGFSELVSFILGDTGVPYDWEYGSQAGKS